MHFGATISICQVFFFFNQIFWRNIKSKKKNSIFLKVGTYSVRQ